MKNTTVWLLNVKGRGFHRCRLIVSRQRNFAARITSYNVCYTKLLRIFFKPYALAKKVRAALGHILQSLELPCAEIFPKQDDLLPKNGKETFGNMVNMPYFGGEGGVSEHRTLFVDDSGNPLSDLPTIIRITSYNVCYTKLLRPLLMYHDC